MVYNGIRTKELGIFKYMLYEHDEYASVISMPYHLYSKLGGGGTYYFYSFICMLCVCSFVVIERPDERSNVKPVSHPAECTIVKIKVHMYLDCILCFFL